MLHGALDSISWHLTGQGALAAVLHHPAAGLAGTQHASGLVQCRLGAVHCSYSVTTNSTSMFACFILSAPHRSNQAFTIQLIILVCFRENVLLLDQSAWKDPNFVCFAVCHDALWRTLPDHQLVPQWSHQDYQIEQKINVNIIFLDWDWSTSNM